MSLPISSRTIARSLFGVIGPDPTRVAPGDGTAGEAPELGWPETGDPDGLGFGWHAASATATASRNAADRPR
jgi:hypothetical protein